MDTRRSGRRGGGGGGEGAIALYHFVRKLVFQTYVSSLYE